jgi:eukaryotic-like serine/threonine-protein kinase
MTLSAGTHLGPYEILGPLGAGGMGEVYRATDPRLHREVAIKMLPQALSQDPGRLARFRREAQVLASLSHSAIGAIYGMEDSSGTPALILELVEGPTLSDRIAAGPVPLDEALPIALQIAEGLEAAHERGIIHRDLKPANIKVSPDGRVKLLDFGLARMSDPDLAPSSGADQSQSPTVLQGMTHAGYILGTAPYMSPEQARGKLVDRRSDVWAFGCILYEMLTGRPAFPGETVSDTLVSVLKGEPDWRLLPEGMPPSIRNLLLRCLRKDPMLRLRDIGDARITIREAIDGVPDPVQTAIVPIRPARPRILTYAALAAGCAAAGALLAWLALRGGTAPTEQDLQLVEVTRLTHDTGFSQWPTWSPDGSLLAFSSNRSGNYEVYVRRVEGGQEVNITNDASEDIQPSFSPDGESVAFVSTRSSRAGINRIGSNYGIDFRTYGGDLWVVPSLGGQARRWAEDANYPSWHPEGSKIAYVSGPEGHRSILEIAAASGEPRTILSSSDSEWEIVRVEYSPQGDWMSFETGAARVMILPAGGGTPRELIEASSYAWDASGRRLFSVTRDLGGGSRLQAWNLDAGSGRIEGGARTLGVLTGILRDPAVSRDGTRIAAGELEEALNLTLLPLTADGGAAGGEEVVLSRGQVVDSNPAFSPDGRRLAFASDRLGPKEIWLLDLETRLQKRLQMPEGGPSADFPFWSPDGRQIAVTRFEQTDKESIWLAAHDGSHAEEIVPPTRSLQGGPFSPDGKWMLYAAMSEGTHQLFVLEIATRRARKLTLSPGEKAGAIWSPDGRWIAYGSNVGGAFQLWRMPFAGGKEEQLTTGHERMRHMFYSPDGRWIYVQPSHRNIYRLPASGGLAQPVTRFPESGLFIEEPTLSPDGRTLAYCRSNGGGSLWLLTLGMASADSRSTDP